MSSPVYSLEELVAAVNAWCNERGLEPANGQSAEQLSARTLRYYRTMGLLLPPNSGGGVGYGEMHRLQLCAIRVLQAQGLPLRRIQTLLYGRSVAHLRTILEKGSISTFASNAGLPLLPKPEDWRVTPIDDSVWLILRNGRQLSHAQFSQIAAILNATPHEESLSHETERKS